MTDFQSEQLDYDRSEDLTRDLNHYTTAPPPYIVLLFTMFL